MKKILIAFIILCIAYFIGGYLAVNSGRLSQDSYILYASIAGSLASVVGLLSLVKPAFTRTDIQALDVDALKRITKAAEEMEQYKNQRNATEQELAELSLQKEEMQFLVRKASLSLFLTDQLESRQKRILEIVSENRELGTLIAEYSQQAEKLDALDEEIEKDKNVELLHEILTSATRSKDEYEVNATGFISRLGYETIKILRILNG